MLSGGLDEKCNPVFLLPMQAVLGVAVSGNALLVSLACGKVNVAEGAQRFPSFPRESVTSLLYS